MALVFYCHSTTNYPTLQYKRLTWCHGVSQAHIKVIGFSRVTYRARAKPPAAELQHEGRPPQCLSALPSVFTPTRVAQRRHALRAIALPPLGLRG
jgi:hypothetical protein